VVEPIWLAIPSGFGAPHVVKPFCANLYLFVPWFQVRIHRFTLLVVKYKMSQNPVTATIVIAVYNDWPLLECLLASLKAQWHHQFDVAIADDGSNATFVAHVRQAQQQRYPFKIHHHWQADNGFGKTIVMNQAVANAQNPYLIFIDGDCIPQKHFVDDHLRLARKGQCLAGRRVDLPRDVMQVLDMTHPDTLWRRHIARLVWMSLTQRARNIEKGLRIGLERVNLFANKARGIVGCNFSIFREDLLAINGFDERFNTTWGAEDSDVDRRLRLNGVRVQRAFMCAAMIHFDSSYAKREAWAAAPIDPNKPRYFEMAAAEGSAWTRFGIDKG